MRLRAGEALFLFVLGAAGGLLGDAGNVQSGATRYLDDSVPFIWESPLWFAVLVGFAAVSIGEIRLRLGPTRPGADPRIGVAAFAAVIGIYAVTSIVGDDSLPSATLVTALGVIVVCLIADRPGVVCALLACVIGPLTEAAITTLELSEYTEANDALLGVGFWLPGLYLAFGAAVARIAELLVAARRAEVS